jgi:hypothetical protein
VPPSQGPEITAEFNFINGDDFTSIKPYFYGGDLPSDKEYLRSNITYKPVADIGVVDIGGCKDEFNLEQHGLEFLEPTDLLRALPGTEDELKRYLTNLAEWLRDVLQAERAIVYDYAVSVWVVCKWQC